jgi:hypothetical protein
MNWRKFWWAKTIKTCKKGDQLGFHNFKNQITIAQAGHS